MKQGTTNWAAYAELAGAFADTGQRIVELAETLVEAVGFWHAVNVRQERRRMKAIQRSRRLQANPKTRRHGERAGVYRKRSC